MAKQLITLKVTGRTWKELIDSFSSQLRARCRAVRSDATIVTYLNLEGPDARRCQSIFQEVMGRRTLGRYLPPPNAKETGDGPG